VLAGLRSKLKWAKGLSFETISSVGENAAIIHYSPTKEKNSPMDKDKIYLLDSGGHYWDGTTDTTRTVHFGQPTEREKEFNTRVLLGNLDV
jgi:Xaa-Pro aminopeptidase